MDVGHAHRAIARKTLRQRTRLMVILLTLAVLVVPAVTRHLAAEREARLQSALHVLRDAISLYREAYGQGPATLRALVEARFLRALPRDPLLDRSDAWQLVRDGEDGRGGIRDVHSSAEGADRAGRPWSSW